MRIKAIPMITATATADPTLAFVKYRGNKEMFCQFPGAHHQRGMPARCGDFEGALDVFLSFNLAEVRWGEERFEFVAFRLIRLDRTAAR